nr:MAG TPA: hypothetical protein [Caudoviricetes sp.]
MCKKRYTCTTMDTMELIGKACYNYLVTDVLHGVPK